MRKITFPYGYTGATPFIGGDEEERKSGVQKWENFVESFDIKSLIGHSKLGKNGFEIFDYTGRFSFARPVLLDHIEVYKTNGFSYVVVVQPYSTAEDILNFFASNIEVLYYCIRNKYKINVYANDMYNWHNSSCTAVVFEVPLRVNDWELKDMNFQFLEVNVHVKDRDGSNIVKTVRIKPSVDGWDDAFGKKHESDGVK